MIKLLCLSRKAEQVVIMYWIKMKKNKKAQVPGWIYIIGLIIGLFVIAFFIWVTVKSGGAQSDWLGKIR